MARNIAPTARIGIVAPGTANAIRLLEKVDVGVSGLFQFRHRSQPAHASAEDRDTQRLSVLS